MILLLAASLAYQCVAFVACLVHLRKRDRISGGRPPVSILKPVYGADDAFYAASVSHARIAYPEFELLFGIRDQSDTALPQIFRLQTEFPDVKIRIIQVHTDAPNAKVGSLIDLEREARYDVLVVNDSDIAVPPAYLDVVTAPLEDADIGLVTCLYRASANSFASKWEALGIATDFAPSALVAPLVGVNEFGLGSTLCFRRRDLGDIGGFASIGSFIADDYQLGKRISRSGKKVVLTRMPVETHLGAASWKSVWDHQVRWARTIRTARSEYLGLPFTNGTLWAVLAILTGNVSMGIALVAVRMAVAFVAANRILRDPLFRWMWPLVPARDLWGFAVWIAGAFPGAVVWRGKRLMLDKHGRIHSLQ